MPTYCTAADVKLLATPEIEDVAEENTAARLAAYIAAASALVDRLTDRPDGYFSPAAAEPSERRYRGEGRNYLRVGRYVAADGLAFTSPIVAATSYDLDPANGWPRWKDYPTNDQVDYHPLYRDEFFARGQVYAISARWGFAETPPDIKMATALICGKFWDLGEGVIGEVSPSGFVIERDIPLTARALLTPYRRREFEIN